MFKYTPPWQVLCNSLENENRKTSGCIRVHQHEEGTAFRLLNQPTIPPVSWTATDHLSAKTTMGSTPKRWVMKPLTPRLEKSDLRAMLSPGPEPFSSEKLWRHYQDEESPMTSLNSINPSVTGSSPNGEDVVVHARQVVVNEFDCVSDDWEQSIPSSSNSVSSDDSHVGFYSFVDDPKSQEAVKNEAYMVSPERLSKMSTLKEKSRFKLQTYVEERRPEKMFQESNEDSLYHVNEMLVENEDEEQPNRLEIIHSQAPKRNFKEQWSSLESLSLRSSPQRLVEGFSLSYSPVHQKRLSEVEPGTIDNQQIDFNEARKQFLTMEQTPIWYGSQQVINPPKIWGGSAYKEATPSVKNGSIKDVSLQNQPLWKRQEEAKTTMIIDGDSEQIEQSSLKDQEVVDGNQAVGITNEMGSFTEPFVQSVSHTSETPIEREIRIAQEREEDLRRSRGIFHPDTSEMIEIETKPILSQPSPQLKPIKPKDSNRMSLLIQWDLEMLNQNSGYDRRTPDDRREKTRLGSLADQVDKTPLETDLIINQSDSAKRGKETQIPKLLDRSNEDVLSPCCPHRHQNERVVHWEDNAVTERQKVLTPTQMTWVDKATDSGKTFTPVKYLSFSADERWSLSERPRIVNASETIRKEIEDDLRREQELQQLRETNASALTLSPLISSREISNVHNSNFTSQSNSQENLMRDGTVLPENKTQKIKKSFPSSDMDTIHVVQTDSGPKVPSVSFVTAQPWSGLKPSSPALNRWLPNLLLSPVTETFSTTSQKSLTETLLKDFEERRIKLKLEESAYAGIQPVDAINNEVVEATRVTRHKNTRALRWEAGVYANEETD